MERRSLNDLPAFSPWPARLLGIAPWTTRRKTPGEIEREFGREKWGALLQRFRDSPQATLDEVDRWAAGEGGPSLASMDASLFLMTHEESHAAYIDQIAAAVATWLPARGLVELGCGYGSVILGLGRRADFSGIPLFAADFTSTGPELAAALAARENVDVALGRCDLTADPVTTLPIPPGSVIYTAYAAQYVEQLTDSFVAGLIALRPRAVVHIEPVYEHCDPQTLLGLLRQRYIQANGYNRNLVTILRDHEGRGSLDIIRESVPGFGPNPLLAASVIAWVPRSPALVQQT